MTSPEPSPLTAEEQALAERLARLGPRAEPSPALDARVLAAAHAAAQEPPASRLPPRRQRWPAIVGLAASLVLAVGLAWRLRPEAPRAPRESVAAFRMVVPPAPSAPAATAATAAAPAPDAVPSTPIAPPQPSRDAGVAAQAHAAETKSSAANSAAERAAPKVPDAMTPVESPPPPAPPPAPEALRDVAPQARATAPAPPAAVPAPAPTAQDSGLDDSANGADRASAFGDVQGKDEPADEVPPATVESPAVRDAWLQRIRRLIDAGDIAGARASLREFQRRYPDYPLPEDLRALAR